MNTRGKPNRRDNDEGWTLIKVNGNVVYKTGYDGIGQNPHVVMSNTTHGDNWWNFGDSFGSLEVIDVNGHATGASKNDYVLAKPGVNLDYSCNNYKDGCGLFLAYHCMTDPNGCRGYCDFHICMYLDGFESKDSYMQWLEKINHWDPLMKLDLFGSAKAKVIELKHQPSSDHLEKTLYKELIQL